MQILTIFKVKSKKICKTLRFEYQNELLFNVSQLVFMFNNKIIFLNPYLFN